MGRRWRELFASSVVCTAAAILPVNSDAAPICPADRAALAQLVSVQGTVELNADSAELGTLIHLNDVLRVGSQSRAAIVLCETDTVLRVDQNTVLRFEAPRQDRSLLRLIRGAVYFFTQEPQALDFETPFVNAGVKGTEFVLRVDGEDKTTVIVIEGVVQLTPVPGAETTFEQPQETLVSGQSVEAVGRRLADGTLRIVVSDTVVDERQAVQWAVYYQPVLAAAAAARVPEAIRRASELLRGGRLTEARGILENYSQRGEARALLAVIAVAQNDRAQALVHATRAVELDPESAPARIALSYALQASFRLEAARDAVQTAVRLEPQNALAWARLAELQMSLGELSEALESARNAEGLSPGLARTQIVLGFAALARSRIAEAAEAFQAAVALDSQDPLARLGLGLSKIREGRLSDGRRELEIAVALDPNGALLRSYLGKAYFDERRPDVAAEQLDRAKEQDPDDPTPWFYDAIVKQTTNRPIEALRAQQRSIELNENRAVYRSRLLLDQDLAARSAALGRIYRDLGFGQLALVQGWKSTETDPGDFSGHRFLADTYAALPRHQPARVSELLQSQLLQPTNITPVQPTLGEANLFIFEGSGPTTPGFNEFNPLFQRNRFALQASGVIGGNDTLGDEIAHSGIRNELSYSIGQFHYETDGFRPNNDQEQNIYNLFLQLAPRPETSFQTEFRFSERETGDLELNFDPDNFNEALRQEQDVEQVRVGLRHAPGPGRHFLASFIHRQVDERLEIRPALRAKGKQDGVLIEGQYLHRLGRANLIGGVSHFNADETTATTVVISVPFPPFVIELTEEVQGEIDHTTVYGYSNIRFPGNLLMTLGLSGDFLDADIDTEQVNPKIGLTWNPTPDTTIRAAALRTLQRSTILRENAAPTIEPTHVAGFNQFFFGSIGEDAWRYGAGVDQRFSLNLYGGAEFSMRDLDVPISVVPAPPAPPIAEVVTADWKEYLGRAYLNWTPTRRLALSAEYLYEEFDRVEEPGLTGVENIAELRTHRVPLRAGYFHPSGITVQVRGTYANQEGEFEDPESGAFSSGDDRFWVLDASLGFRLPKRFGLIELQVRNALDENFRFQDTDPQSPTVLPERVVFLKATFSL